MQHYRHTQKARWIFALLGAAAGVTVIAAFAVNDPVFWLICLGCAAFTGTIAWLFSSLTVEVDDSELKWFFGPGFWRKSVPRSDILHASAIRTQWWHGWGIRYTPMGWLYNVYGLDAVAVARNGRRAVLIGTDEPDALLAALGFPRST